MSGQETRWYRNIKTGRRIQVRVGSIEQLRMEGDPDWERTLPPQEG